MKQKVFAFVAALSLVFSMAAYAEEEAAMAEAPKVAIKYGQAIGDNIRPVVISSIDGSSKVEIAKLEKKTIFVMISSVCTACRKEVQELGENIEKFKDKADIYGVIIDMDVKEAAKRIGQVPFPLLADSEYKVGDATNLMSTPSTLIVKDGKILYSRAGYRPGQWRELLAEK